VQVKHFAPLKAKYFPLKLLLQYNNNNNNNNNNKGKAVPLEAWAGPQDSRRSRLPDF
jgi:hypothetical protein